MARHQEFDEEEVLRRAMTVFWRQGYKATSLTDLMEETGLSKSSLYGSFGDKRALFLAAYDVFRADMTRAMDEILSREPARDALEAFFLKIVADAQAHPFSNGCMTTNQAVEMAPLDPAVKERVEADFQLLEDAFFRTVEQGQSDGSIASGKPAHELARLLIVSVPGVQVMVRAGADRRRLEEAVPLILAHLDG